MTQRISFQDLPKNLLDGLFKTGAFLKNSDVDQKLLDLLYYRASQINGCAMCLDMHYKEAIHHGETHQRLHGVIAWRETPYFDERERAALAYTEALTNANQQDISDDIYEALEEHFTKAQIATLALAVGTVNVWNRLNKTFRTVPGHYEVGQFA